MCVYVCVCVCVYVCVYVCVCELIENNHLIDRNSLLVSALLFVAGLLK